MLPVAPTELADTLGSGVARALVRGVAVLCVHNYYRQSGGEDHVLAAEMALLEDRGHRVSIYTDNNARIMDGQVRLALESIWNGTSHDSICEMLRKDPVDVVHVHNTFPLISPSAYYAAKRSGAAVVQTLHNFRLLCPGATLYRDGTVCEECVNRNSFLPSLVHRCYRNSFSATLATASTLTVHRVCGTFETAVDQYIALSEFARARFINNGLPRDRVAIKPNFVVPDPGPGEGVGGYALFVGRLSPEKGIETLRQAWERLDCLPLEIAGEGPLSRIAWPLGVNYLGRQTHDRTIELIQNASVLVFPSTWYECAPMTIIEAQACGTPVIASNLGSMPEFVRHGYNGLLFRPGDPEDLARQVRWAFDHPDELRAMRLNARREFEEKYTAERNYKMLMAIYEQAIETSRRRQRDRSAFRIL